MDLIAQFKERQRGTWSSFVAFESFTAAVAPDVVRRAGIVKGQSVLDVGCGTGVVALTAARLGAQVTGLDLTPELIIRAKQNAALMRLDVRWREGDVESLPFEDGEFDCVVSQFGHMFAPRPEVAVTEMLRVLRPGGTLAFATWPPDHFVGRVFSLMASYAPPPPPGVASPPEWGDVDIVRQRLGARVDDLSFERGVMIFPALSVQHYRAFMEAAGPAGKLLELLDATDPTRAAALRGEMEQLASQYFADNVIRQEYLVSRATKRA